MRTFLRSAASRSALVATLALAGAAARAASSDVPHLVHKDGRHALIVDGAPFLILGGQCHNSSAWPKTLPGVWSAIEALQANTLEAPISWEQFEPEPGRFDTSIVDELLAGARERHVRLVLLWFGTWKNGSAHYLPAWMKRPARALPADRRQGRPACRLAVAPRPGPPRGRRARVPRAHAAPQDRGPQAHGDPGAGRERARRLEHGPRLLARCAAALHGSGSDGAAEGARQGEPHRGRLDGRVRQGRRRVLPRVVGRALHRPGGGGGQGGVPAAALRQRRAARPAVAAARGNVRERRADRQRARRLEGGRPGRRPAGARHLHGRQRAVPEGARPVRPSRQRPLRSGDGPRGADVRATSSRRSLAARSAGRPSVSTALFAVRSRRRGRPRPIRGSPSPSTTASSVR